MSAQHHSNNIAGKVVVMTGASSGFQYLTNDHGAGICCQ